MKKLFNITVILMYCAFAKAQTVEADLLLQTAHGATTARTDVTGTPENGMFFFDSVTKRAYVFTDGVWRKVYYAPIINQQAGAYTLLPSDDGNVITINTASDVTLTVPTGLEVGFNVSIYQIGTGRVTIVGAGGATVLNRLSRFRTAGPNSGAGIICTASNVYHVTGDLKR